MSDIFISYAREDHDRAKSLANTLKRKGWSVWWDRTIQLGQSFDQEIEKALDASKCVIVLWSSASVASDWVRVEAAEGARRKILIPALIEKAKIPLQFRNLQTADLIGWRGSARHPELQSLLKSISNILSAPTASRKAGARPAVRRRAPSRTAFQRDLAELFRYAKEDFRPIRGRRDWVGDDGSKSYVSKFSIDGSSENTIWHNGSQGYKYFTCTFITDVSEAEAAVVFNQKAKELRQVIPKKWEAKTEVSSKGVTRKDLSVFDEHGNYRISMALSVYKLGKSHVSDVDFTFYSQ